MNGINIIKFGGAECDLDHVEVDVGIWIWHGLLRFLYPPRCILCQKSLSNQPGLCNTCAEMVGLNEGKQIDVSQIDGIDVYFLQAFNDPLRKLIHMLKYQGKTLPGRLLGQALGNGLVGELGMADWLVVPVPLYSARKRERGYNQSAIIARAMGQVTGFQVCETGLKRVRHTPSQTRLDRKARYLNMDSAFAVRDASVICGRLVILIDDVVTTGATISACVKVLIEAGVKQVVVATVARPELGEDMSSDF
jgi:competence protein ComFC